MPSKNEQVVLNYNIEDYYYIKVLIHPSRNLSMTLAPDSSGTKPLLNSSHPACYPLRLRKYQDWVSKRNLVGFVSISRDCAFPGWQGLTTCTSKRTTFWCPASSTQKKLTCTKKLKFSSSMIRSMMLEDYWGSGCILSLMKCSHNILVCSNFAILMTLCTVWSGTRKSTKSSLLNCWCFMELLLARPSSKKYQSTHILTAPSLGSSPRELIRSSSAISSVMTKRYLSAYSVVPELEISAGKLNQRNGLRDLLRDIQRRGKLNSGLGGTSIRRSEHIGDWWEQEDVCQSKVHTILLSIATLCKEKVERSINFIRKGLYRVIP